MDYILGVRVVEKHDFNMSTYGIQISVREETSTASDSTPHGRLGNALSPSNSLRGDILLFGSRHDCEALQWTNVV
jgi:hypothetical protein